ncbi:MAG: hypothetical protein IJ002_08625 [Clostridia bacterium]|nr:hypothetical protein [Clostridia bacterium]
MGISMYNEENIIDPTPCIAIANIENKRKREIAELKKHRPLVYICSPFAGDVRANVKAARKYCRFAVLEGKIPFAPHLLFTQFLNDKKPFERELGMVFGNIMMGKCTEVWVFGETISPGMHSEIEYAKERHYRIRFFNKRLEEVTPKCVI